MGGGRLPVHRPRARSERTAAGTAPRTRGEEEKPPVSGVRVQQREVGVRSEYESRGCECEDARPQKPATLTSRPARTKEAQQRCRMAGEAKRRVRQEKAGIGNRERLRMRRLSWKVPFRLDWERFELSCGVCCASGAHVVLLRRGPARYVEMALARVSGCCVGLPRRSRRGPGRKGFFLAPASAAGRLAIEQAV